MEFLYFTLTDMFIRKGKFHQGATLGEHGKAWMSQLAIPRIL